MMGCIAFLAVIELLMLPKENLCEVETEVARGGGRRTVTGGRWDLYQ